MKGHGLPGFVFLHSYFVSFCSFSETSITKPWTLAWYDCLIFLCFTGCGSQLNWLTTTAEMYNIKRNTCQRFLLFFRQVSLKTAKIYQTPSITCCGFSWGNIIKSYIQVLLCGRWWLFLHWPLPAHTWSDFLIILRSWPLVNYSGCRVLIQKASQDALPVLLQCF